LNSPSYFFNNAKCFNNANFLSFKEIAFGFFLFLRKSTHSLKIQGLPIEPCPIIIPSHLVSSIIRLAS
jgi:hypothetical protein